MQRIKDAGSKRLAHMRQTAEWGMETAAGWTRTVVYYTVVVTLTLSVLFCVSVASYATIYYSFVPAADLEGLMNPVFEPCKDSMGKCSYMNASVSLSKRNPVLMADKGLDYSVSVVLEMPESPSNRESGMFLMCLSMKATSGDTVRSECRSTMLHYRSELLRAIETLVLSPLFMSGHILESQKLTVTFADDYRDDPLKPVTAIDLQILSRFVEVYCVRLQIHARFPGLRYIMFHSPLLSAVIGTLLQVIVLSVIILFSWCKVFDEAPTTRNAVPERPAPSSRRRKSTESEEKPADDEKITEKDDKIDEDISLRRRVQVVN